MPRPTQKIEQAAKDGTLMQKLTARNTHVNKHKIVSDKDSLERTFDQVNANSVFDPDIDVDRLIENSILYKSNEIMDWLDEAEYYETKEFHVRMDPEDYSSVGHGFIYDFKSNIVREYNTDTIKMVLQKNTNLPLGFSLLTAYPDMNSPTVTPTKRDLREIAKTTEQYQNSDPVGKAYLLYRTDPRNTTSIAYKKGTIPEDSVIYMHVPTGNPNTTHIIKLKEYETTMKTVTAEQDTIPTKYTQIRDDTNPGKTFGNLSVRLNSKPIRDAFAKDHKNESRAIGAMIRTIRENIPPERARVFQPKQTQGRAAQAATQLSISQPQTDDTQYQ